MMTGDTRYKCYDGNNTRICLPTGWLPSQVLLSLSAHHDICSDRVSHSESITYKYISKLCPTPIITVTHLVMLHFFFQVYNKLATVEYR